MDDVARFSTADRTDLFTASASKRGLNVVIVEKDFWVYFRLPELERDYSFMRNEMIFGNAPTLGDIIDVLRKIEREING